ncbi:glycoside hydrolase family 43 protein [Flammeovirga kamogawensis]|uniref:Glycoside hydrolase family 43 protein n=1 Tax=Flammeovirga kamogawensis TaxID=373891 RepID=A0ABX8H416_9BACT|nr:glycoside hydrolase family 43 protein [Flammeovirga kamogawensis]MBB6461840.1 alpha-N-arabinofuranosidase [Flammeovirga kamogawensis]QWG10545.1 glycoside hydrolase family 43 protein [Flammeovirga kamogawensis]TRX63653.1 glycoside hydrolase family 43 protein [Flammeovirga kamogawensis]
MYRLILLLLLFAIPTFAQDSTFKNPILQGGYPDPSITSDGEYYYIVNSSFEYFPGLPIHRSKDLVNWELIGYGLHREEQCNGEMNLVDVQQNGGIHAPTLRYHDGKFYIITTNVYNPIDGSPTKTINFIITADKAEGPWSEPHIIEGAPGIDPDLFFDDNGDVWYFGANSPENPTYEGEGEIYGQQLDLNEWKFIGERQYLYRGACGGVWVEGPHMYKHDGLYYLMVAEGGTSYNHSMMIAVSDDIKGTFVSNERNPILTTRNLSYDNWVNSTGHADIIQLKDGRWYMVALGIRGDVQRATNMGRETFLVPVQWEREPFWWKEPKYDWPVVAPETGRVMKNEKLPFTDKVQYRDGSFKDDFDTDVLNLEWNFRRVPLPNTYSLTKKSGFLRVFAKPEIIKMRGQASLMGVRQRETDFDYSAKMQFAGKKEGVEAGISIFQKDDNYINMTVTKQNGKYVLKVAVAEKKVDKVKVIKEQVLDNYNSTIVFKVVSRENKYHFMYSLDNGKSFAEFVETKADYLLSFGWNSGYTGAYCGVYVTSNGKASKEYADFDWIDYKGFEH